MYKHLFGPVPSRRLGMSLGLDLIPHKICSLNCVYCECGKSTTLTSERKEYVPVVEVYRELNDFFESNPDTESFPQTSGQSRVNSGKREATAPQHGGVIRPDGQRMDQR